MEPIIGLVILMVAIVIIIKIIRSILVWIGGALGEGAQKARDEAARKHSDDDG